MDSPSVMDIAAVGTLAGSGKPGFRDGALRRAMFDGPRDACALPDGSLLVADDRNNCLRRVHVNAFLDVGAPDQATTRLETAKFLGPRSPVVVDSGAGVLVCDSRHHKVRLIQFTEPDTAGGGRRPALGELGVTDAIVAGSGRRGHADGTATSAAFDTPSGLAVLDDGSVLVADTGNHCIRRIAPRTGGRRGLVVTTVAGVPGGATAASAGTPGRAGSRSGGPRVAGSALGVMPGGGHLDGAGHEAIFDSPTSLLVDGSGLVYVSDTGNHCVRALHPPLTDGPHRPGAVAASAWHVATVAGVPRSPGCEDGAPGRARFRFPLGLAATPDGAVLVADAGSATVRCLLPLPADAAIRADVRSPFGELLTVAGRPRPAGGRGASYADGSTSAALFRRPTGLCVIPGTGGCVAVCDETNSLVRVLLQRRTITHCPPGLLHTLPDALRPSRGTDTGETGPGGVPPPPPPPQGRSPPRSHSLAHMRARPSPGSAAPFATTTATSRMPPGSSAVAEGPASAGRKPRPAPGAGRAAAAATRLTASAATGAFPSAHASASPQDRRPAWAQASGAGAAPQRKSWVVEAQLARAADAAAAAMGAWGDLHGIEGVRQGDLGAAGASASVSAAMAASGSPSRRGRAARMRQRADAVERRAKEAAEASGAGGDRTEAFASSLRRAMVDMDEESRPGRGLAGGRHGGMFGGDDADDGVDGYDDDEADDGMPRPGEAHSRYAAQAALEAAGSPGAAASLLRRTQERDAEADIERRLGGAQGPGWGADPAVSAARERRAAAADADAKASREAREGRLRRRREATKRSGAVSRFMQHTAASVARSAASGLVVPGRTTDAAWRFRNPGLVPYVRAPAGVSPDRRTPHQLRRDAGLAASAAGQPAGASLVRGPGADLARSRQDMLGLPLTPKTIAMRPEDRRLAVVLRSGDIAVPGARAANPPLVPADVAVRGLRPAVAESYAIVQAFHPSLRNGLRPGAAPMLARVTAVRAYGEPVIPTVRGGEMPSSAGARPGSRTTRSALMPAPAPQPVRNGGTAAAAGSRRRSIEPAPRERGHAESRGPAHDALAEAPPPPPPAQPHAARPARAAAGAQDPSLVGKYGDRAQTWGEASELLSQTPPRGRNRR